MYSYKSDSILVIVFLTVAALAVPQNAQDLVRVSKGKTILLNEFTPQARLHLPLRYAKQLTEDYTCDFWVSFLESMPPEQWEPHLKYGISVGAKKLGLLNGTTLELSFRSPGNETNIVRNVTWNRPTYNNSTISQEFKSEGHNLCIRMAGEWSDSNSADLVLTLYFEGGSQAADCPDGMEMCTCNGYGFRCISTDLFCNGVPNCGMWCSTDESERFCRVYSQDEQKCVWDFEYLLMMIMTGFLLILIPVVFLLTMMYHRRAANALRSGDCDSNNNVQRCRNFPHVITTIPVHIDEPPSYDDLPDELKVPPRVREQRAPDFGDRAV